MHSWLESICIKPSTTRVRNLIAQSTPGIAMNSTRPHFDTYFQT